MLAAATVVPSVHVADSRTARPGAHELVCDALGIGEPSLELVCPGDLARVIGDPPRSSVLMGDEHFELTSRLDRFINAIAGGVELVPGPRRAALFFFCFFDGGLGNAEPLLPRFRRRLVV